MNLQGAVLPCAGFSQGPEGCFPGRTDAKCLHLAASEGRFRLTVRIEARQNVPMARLFANHRRLLWQGALQAGETQVTCYVLNHPFLLEDSDQVQPFQQVELALCAENASITNVCLEPVEIPALLVMGDSTVTDQETLSPYAPGATYCGWGQLMPRHVGMFACVGNFARSGRTVETIRTDGLYDLLLSQLRPGDTVLMQFGHNDQKRPHLTSDGGYARALERFIGEIRQAGGKPVVVTPLARNSWRNEQTYFDLLADFSRAAKAVAARADTPVIDLHGFMVERLLATGRDAAKVYFHQGDYTHTNDFGAGLAANFVAQELDRLGLMSACTFPVEQPYGPYDVPACSQGDEALPPIGLEAFYRSYETNPDGPVTRQQALELVVRTCGLFAHNAPTVLPDDIPLNESYSADVRCAVQHDLLPDLPDGKLHRLQAITAEEFNALLSKAYAMRSSAPLPQAEDPLTRAKAVSLCRKAKI